MGPANLSWEAQYQDMQDKMDDIRNQITRNSDDTIHLYHKRYVKLREIGGIQNILCHLPGDDKHLPQINYWQNQEEGLNNQVADIDQEIQNLERQKQELERQL